MPDILTHLNCLEPYLTSTTVRQMSSIIGGILTMTGRVTMLGISRWTEKGGSYRSIQRWFHTVIPWALVFWQFFRQQLLNPEDVYIMAGDESIVTKAGKETYGLDRFFSGLYGKTVAGLSFFALSLINVRERRSYPTMIEQRVRDEAEKAAAKAKARQKKKRRTSKKSKPKRKVGRPKGSKNRDKTRVKLNAELQQIKTMVQKQLMLINGIIPIIYLALDRHFGNNNAFQMVRQCGLHLISKLRHDSALYFPWF